MRNDAETLERARSQAYQEGLAAGQEQAAAQTAVERAALKRLTESVQEGMQDFDNQIEKMVRSGLVSKEDGLAYASNQGNLLLKLGEFGGGAVPAVVKLHVSPLRDKLAIVRDTTRQ